MSGELPIGGDKTPTTPTPAPASQSDVEILKLVMVGVIVVLLVGFVTFILQQYLASQAAFEDLKDQVTAQNAKMDLIILQLQDRKSTQ